MTTPEQEDLKLKLMRLLDEIVRHYDDCRECSKDVGTAIKCEVMRNLQFKKEELLKQLNESEPKSISKFIH